MAKASKQPREASLPLIISLVFFILLSIGLGVFVYVLNSDQAAKDAEVTKAKKEVTEQRAAVKEAQDIALVHRVFSGLTDGDDVEKLGAIKEGDKAFQEIKRLNDMAKKRAPELAKADADRWNKAVEVYYKGLAAKDPTDPPKLDVGDLIKGEDFVVWPVDNLGGKALTPPSGSLIDTTVRARIVRDLAMKQANADAAAYATALDLMASVSAEYRKARTTFGDEAKKFPLALDTKMKAVEAAADKRRGDYDRDQATAAKNVDDKDALIADMRLKQRNLETQIGSLKDDIRSLQLRASAKVDPFQFDEPQGKILKRLPENLVEIDLGSAAAVQPGLTFSVLPYDFPQKGRQSRMRETRISDGKGSFKTIEVFAPKATIEIVEVLGPNSSRARVTEQGDQFRDPILGGDLLYNSVWRKGQSDHIALIGIFDVNGDGTDDIEMVVRDLLKMGIPVDAWYDLRTSKWQGRITERTRFVVEGYLPGNSEIDPNRDAKTKLIGGMGAAIKDLQNKGVSIISFRDFFPRMGYKVRNDVPEDRINQALTRYLSGVGTSDEKPMKDGN